MSKYKTNNRNKKGITKRVTTYKINLGRVTAKAYKDAMKYDGLWILLTNIPENADDIFFDRTNFDNFFEIYRLKNTIEESFKILSDFVEVEPFYVYKAEHIKAHFTICVLSYLIDTTILNKMRSSSKC